VSKYRKYVEFAALLLLAGLIGGARLQGAHLDLGLGGHATLAAGHALFHELGERGLDAYTETKTVTVSLN
jgi:hypothetical protein